MSNSTLNNPFLIILNIIQLNISRYGYLIIFILGNIGGILNILILSQRNYRRNSCSSYILASSLPNLLIINIPILTRILFAFNFDLTSGSTFYCKFQWYILHAMALVSRTYILLASIDRWAMTSTSVRRREFAQIKVSMVLIPITGILWCLVSIHVLIYQNNNTGRCIPSTNAYAIFFNIYGLVLVGIIILILMSIFSILTIKNIKKRHQRINPRIQVNNHLNLVNKKIYEDQLLFMILVQQFVYIFTTLPFAIFSFYSAITTYWIKSNIQIAIENLSSTIINVIVLTNFCMTFYIYVLISQTFRKDLKRLLYLDRLMDEQIIVSRQVEIRMEVFNGTQQT